MLDVASGALLSSSRRDLWFPKPFVPEPSYPSLDVRVDRAALVTLFRGCLICRESSREAQGGLEGMP